jgi:hypothetical protein
MQRATSCRRLLDVSLDRLASAIEALDARPGDVLAVPEKPILLARNCWSPDEFEFAAEVPGLTDAWADVQQSLVEREVLYLYSIGGGPGGAWIDVVRSYDLPDVRVYTRECDYPESGTFVVGTAPNPDDQTDAALLGSCSCRVPK